MASCIAVMLLVAAVAPITCPSATAQTGEWVWMGGSSTVPCNATTCFSEPGVYGTLGVPTAGNIPGGRDSAVSWTDSSGNFWLFGGVGTDSNLNNFNPDDLWEFNPTLGANGEWAWMGGSSTSTYSYQPGVYGALGVPAAGNIPGGRSSAVSWTDSSGNLWLLGGSGYDALSNYGMLNDLWEFNPTLGANGEWAWMGGSSTMPVEAPSGVYGTLGVPAAGNVPGGRVSAASWSDRSGNFYLFGGYGYDASPSYTPTGLQDLWEFNPALGTSGEWAWIGGLSIPSNFGIPGVYGALGTPAAGNIPGGRNSAVSWTDSSGNFWLFGGFGVDAADNSGDLNDLWEFNPALGTYGEWAWMGGSELLPFPQSDGVPGVYGTLGVPAAGNIPGGRSGAVSWTDSSGNLWLLGGSGYDSLGDFGLLNDLWEFNPTLGPNGEWAWMGGSKTIQNYHGLLGVYGTLGVPAAGNEPGGRSGAVSWTDSSGNFWLFGGEGYDSAGVLRPLNDLWEYQFLTATPAFSVEAGTYASAQSVTISDATPGAAIYYTTDGTTPTTSSNFYNGPISVSSTETITAIAVASGRIDSGVASATYTLPVTFTLALKPVALTLAPGGQGAVTLTVTPQNGFNSAISFFCIGLPAGVSCSFNPATVTPIGSSAMTTQLTIAVSAQASVVRPGSRPFFPVAGLAVAACFFVWRRRRMWFGMTVLALVLASAGLLSGCGGGGSAGGGGGGGSPQSYTVTLMASSGTIHQTATVTLTEN